MQYREIATDDIDELFSWGTGWDQEYLQLSPGPLCFRSRVIRLADVLIEWNSFGQSVLFREVLREPALVFGFLLDAGGVTKYRGREIAPNDGLIYHPGLEQEYRNPRDTKSLVVVVAPQRVRTLGWTLSDRRIGRVPQSALQRLVHVCSEASEVACRGNPSAVADTIEEALRDRVLTALRHVLQPWFVDTAGPSDPFQDPPAAFRLVKNADELMERLHPGNKLEIAELAAELEVPERTLYQAFRSCLNMGPYEYHLLRRMHDFRASLLAGKPFHGKVKQVALATGFQHVARLTQSYSRHFGETPRETMRRRG